MRLFIIGAALLFTTTTVSAQSRWTFSAGPEWRFAAMRGQVFGGRARAEYDLVRPDKPLRLRLEMSGFWEPSQSYFGTIFDSSTAAGSTQLIDITVGMSAAVTPFPKARFAPYATVGVLASQGWNNGWHAISSRQGLTSYQKVSVTGGALIFPIGLGLRARVANRMFQVELRRWDTRTALLVGTSLPF